MVNNDLEIIKYEKAIDKQKMQKSELKFKITAALTTLAIGATAVVTSATTLDTNKPVDTNVETNTDLNELHEEVGDLFARKLDLEAGATENSFVSTAKEEYMENSTVATNDEDINVIDYNEENSVERGSK